MINGYRIRNNVGNFQLMTDPTPYHVCNATLFWWSFLFGHVDTSCKLLQQKLYHMTVNKKVTWLVVMDVLCVIDFLDRQFDNGCLPVVLYLES